MRPLFALLLLATSACARAQIAAPQRPIEIKVVVINMFEAGADTGDTPGEYQYWVEREHLDTVLPFPQGYHDLRLNPHTGVLGLLTGVGTARAAASVMALGLDPRFDLTHAYFLVAGIGGIDPAAGSLASAVWNDWIVDGDLAYEIDAREIPHATPAERALWTTGYIPLRKNVPYEQPVDPAQTRGLPAESGAGGLGVQPDQRHCDPRPARAESRCVFNSMAPWPTGRPSF